LDFLQNSKNVIPEEFNRESGFIEAKTISPIEAFRDDRLFCKRMKRFMAKV